MQNKVNKTQKWDWNIIPHFIFHFFGRYGTDQNGSNISFTILPVSSIYDFLVIKENIEYIMSDH